MSEPGPETLLLAELSPKLAAAETARYALRPGDAVDGLRIDGYLGAGASGEVYAVYDAALDGAFALKLLRRTEAAVRDAFLREARLLAALRHPNIVRVMRAGVWQERPYFVMEKLAPLPSGPAPDEVRRWIVALCGALTELAPRGLSHCDIKPDNILWDEAHRQPVLADFGIAVASGRPASGTPGYSAPEHRASPAADVYALGMLAKSLLPPEAYRPGTPWRTVLTEALAADAELRPPDPAALAERIAELFSGEGGRRHARRIALWAMLCGLLGAAGALLWMRSRPLPAPVLPAASEAPARADSTASVAPARTDSAASEAPARTDSTADGAAPSSPGAHVCTLACDRAVTLKGPKARYTVTETVDHLLYMVLEINPNEPAELIIDIPAGKRLVIKGTITLKDPANDDFSSKGPYDVTVRAVGGGSLSLIQVMPMFAASDLTLRLYRSPDTTVTETRPVGAAVWEPVP